MTSVAETHRDEQRPVGARPRPAGPVICIHEDRRANWMGVQMAVLSLARHAPSLRVLVSCPGADAGCLGWLRQQPNATKLDVPGLESSGWNVKPTILLHLLDIHSEVVWLDSDIIIAADIERFFADLSSDVLLATEETFWGQQQGSRRRTLGWGLLPQRELRCTVNSGVMRVTRHHVDLLEAWRTMLAHPVYMRSQSLLWYQRPVHMIGDQEVLTGLLGSADFSHVPMVLLRRGRDIAQCFGPAGFTPLERVLALVRAGPAFVHAMGPKPWSRSAVPPSLRGRQRVAASLGASLRAWYEYRSLDVSPYCIVAKGYAGQAGVDVAWAWPRSLLGKWLTGPGGCRPPVPGLPLAIFDHCARCLKRLLRVGRYSSSVEFDLRERPF